jgi:hypothetical protein
VRTVRRWRPRVALMLSLLLLGTLASPGHAQPRQAVRIEVLSNRADLLSGGDALVVVDLPPGTRANQVVATVNRRDVSRQLAWRANGRYEGLLSGLPNGASTLTVRVRGRGGARLVLTNHPRGGPVFAGRQILPWTCTTQENGLGRPLDAQCDAPTSVRYVYKSTDPLVAAQGFSPYDPKKPASDVARTTTDTGRTFPYIVRVETGTQDRGIYQTAVLADPQRPWTPWAPQPSWNHKLMVPFGGSCGPLHAQTAPSKTGSTPAMAAGVTVLDDVALSRGFAVTSSGLNTLGQNCNLVVSAEALMMQEEHIKETLGSIRYVIGEGCSGGSIEQQNIAAAYPGLLNGITPGCSFPDKDSALPEVTDCVLLTHYFNEVSPHLWAAGPQRGFVEGHENAGSSCASISALFGAMLDPSGKGPTINASATGLTPCGVPTAHVYDSTSNPHGVRCDIFTYDQAIMGSRRQDGFAKRTVDNVGVEYGLGALRSGEITAAQFVDLNTKIGGLDVDGQPRPARAVADAGAVATAYRSGRVTDGRQLAAVPIIDIRGQDNEEVHESYFSYALRARLDQANGGHANQVIWTGPIPLTGATGFISMAFLAMDRWLAAVEADHRAVPTAQKVAQDRPLDIVDACWIEGVEVTDMNTCRAAFPYYANPRIVAGGPLSSDVLKCRLIPLRRADIPATLTSSQWGALASAFKTGVCDWRRPGVDQQPTRTWTTFAGGPGGLPLPPAPVSVPIRAS